MTPHIRESQEFKTDRTSSFSIDCTFPATHKAVCTTLHDLGPWFSSGVETGVTYGSEAFADISIVAVGAEMHSKSTTATSILDITATSPEISTIRSYSTITLLIPSYVLENFNKHVIATAVAVVRIHSSSATDRACLFPCDPASMLMNQGPQRGGLHVQL